MSMLLLVATASASAAAAAPPVDMAAFLATSDMLWSWNTSAAGAPWMPTDWANSAFLGNGNLGLQVVGGLHDYESAAPPPPLAQNCCCCWNREAQSCNSSSQCDAGGEGCVASGTVTKRYGKVGCSTCSAHGCPPLPTPTPPPPPPPLATQPALRFEVGRLDVTDDRMPGSAHYSGNLKCDRERLAIGYFYLRPLKREANVLNVTMRLHLHDAELSANVTMSTGDGVAVARVRVFTSATSDVNVIDYSPVSPTAPAAGQGCETFAFFPIQGDALKAWQAGAGAAGYKRNPNISTTADKRTGFTVTIQTLLSGNAYSTVVAKVPSADGGCTLYHSTMGRMAGGASRAAAIAAVSAAKDVGFDGLQAAHRSWWHRYYAAGAFISLSDTRLQSFYWAQMYKAASGTRGSVGPPSYGVYDHHGPWFAPSPTTCCILFNWDMNVQVTYWPFATANRLEISASLQHLLTSEHARPALKANTPEPWRHDSIAGPEGHSSFWLLNDPYLNANWTGHPPVALGANWTKPPSYTANLMWALHDVWRQYAYAEEAAGMEALKAFFPVLSQHVNYHLHLLVRESDGKLHLPPSWSPEYNEKSCVGGCGTPNVANMGTGDTTYHLALVKWGLERVIEGCELLKCADPNKARWASILNDLADFATDPRDGGLMLARGREFNWSHRHFSQLFPCFPLGLLNATDKRCEAGADRWYTAAKSGPWDSPSNVGDWCIWSMQVLSSINTLRGKAAEAWSNLTKPVHDYVMPNMLDFGSALTPNTMYGEGCGSCIHQHCRNASQSNTNARPTTGAPCGDPTGESALAVASALQDALLITDRAAGLVRVFGGVPGKNKDSAAADGGPADVVFDRLRCEGGYDVSASRRSGATVFVKLATAFTVWCSCVCCTVCGSVPAATAIPAAPVLSLSLTCRVRYKPPRRLRVATSLNGKVVATPASALRERHADGSVTIVGDVTLRTSVASHVAAEIKPVAPEPQYLHWWGFKRGHSAGY